jgi:hypothetical protein
MAGFGRSTITLGVIFALRVVFRRILTTTEPALADFGSDDVGESGMAGQPTNRPAMRSEIQPVTISQTANRASRRPLTFSGSSGRSMEKPHSSLS